MHINTNIHYDGNNIATQRFFNHHEWLNLSIEFYNNIN